MYLKRLAEDKFNRLSKVFPVVLVCGARQVGKTTMFKNLMEEGRTYVSLDDLDVRSLALNDPKLFFQKFKPPILIDEVQYAPNLFTYIKIMVDEKAKAGDFWLTGSQSYNIMKGVSESLAGRVGILNMYSLTYQEYLQNFNYEIPTKFDFESLQQHKDFSVPNIDYIFSFIFNGGMPKLIGNEDVRADYFNSYINTYLMRDAMEFGKVSDVVKFNKFLIACASQVSNVVNYANLASVSGVSQPTAKGWLEILQGMGIVYLVQPYYNNLLKRMTKSPKLYFYDTGLCSYLAKMPSSESLSVSAFSGAYFENFVMNQIIIKYQLLDVSPSIYFYRDNDQNEIDIVLENFNGVCPLEVKLSASPNKRDLKKFACLNKTGKTVLSGGIVCLCDKLLPIDDKNSFIPVTML